MGKMISVSSLQGDVEAYVAEPKAEPRGGVIVIHEVWGLNDHIKSIADRFAKEGFIALAPNLLDELDITTHAEQLQADLFNPETRNAAQPKLRELMAPIQEPLFAEKTIDRLKACFNELFENYNTQENVSVCGFCFGGSYSYALSMHEPRLSAAIAFYGHANIADIAALRHIQCPVLAFYGAEDTGLIRSYPQVKAAMQKAGVTYESHVYPDCGHAFFNDTNHYAYNQKAAEDAWRRAVDFLHND